MYDGGVGDHANVRVKAIMTFVRRIVDQGRELAEYVG